VRATITRDEAIAVDRRGVTLAGGRRIDADRVVLATGLVPRRAPAWFASDLRIVDAWDEPALHFLPPDGRLLILGSGLSAIDVLGVLEAARFRGRWWWCRAADSCRGRISPTSRRRHRSIRRCSPLHRASCAD